MANICKSDNVRLISNKELVLRQQNLANLPSFNYDLFATRIGFVSVIKDADIIEVDYIKNYKKDTLNAPKSSFERIKFKSDLTEVDASMDYEDHKIYITDAPKITNTSGQNPTYDIPAHISKNPTYEIPEHISAPLGHLMMAIKKNDYNILRQLCKDKTHLYDAEEKNGHTIFHFASHEANLEVMNILRHARCNADAVDIDGNTIMHSAVDGNKIETVKYIFTYYPYLTKKMNSLLETPLQTSCAVGHTDIALYLLKVDASAINSKNTKGYAPIHYVALNGHIEILKALLVRNLNIAEPNIDGWTGFHLACYKNQEKIVKVLLNYCQKRGCCEIFRLCTPEHESGHQLAIRNEHINLAKLIITKDPMRWSDLPISSKYGSILHLATKRASLSLVKLILTFDIALINMRNKKGQTALDIALLLRNSSPNNLSLNTRNVINYLREAGGCTS